MFKKSLAALLLGLAVTTAYADAPVMINVTGDMTDQPFNVNHKQWGYQFNNTTGKTVKFTLTVANSLGPVEVQCWHGPKPVETFIVNQGQTSKPCLTDDAIRIVTSSDRDIPSMGSYSIVVGAK
jgi:hypothetical protein